MLKLISLTTLTCYVAQISANDMLGPGIWSLISIGKCPMKIKDEVLIVDMDKHKVNRTHDGISADVVATDTIDDKYAALIEICKYVDGGCKPYQILSDNSAVNMLNKYAKENVFNALTLAKLDPPEFPVDKGEYHVDDYVTDYCKLPREAIYGEFEALSYLILNNEKVACIKCVLAFDKFEDENYCDE
ncbi:uncharacterized protein LOC113398135 [Vanessa tameamea]|uniref:Uncharacterized protein LOC113398135 n=1 Tax=Vanessa tameamea TaxID=334116 RepID=A0A8B8I630_VANTA|nr:uncharacterized protein LOC113398135 [Vanessa tameamea]